MPIFKKDYLNKKHGQVIKFKYKGRKKCEKNIIKATAIVFSLSFISKIIGFIKSIIQASLFGADIYTDAFNVANGFVGNILFMFTTSIAVAFVPMYIQKKKTGREKKFASTTFTFLAGMSLIITVLLILFAEPIVKLIAPSFDSNEIKIATQYFRILVVGFIFSLIANLYTNLLNAEKIYGFSALGSIVNSVVLIIVMIVFYKQIGIWTLVISVPLSYLIQCFLLYLKGKKYGSISLKNRFWDSSIKVLLMQALPIMISQATVEINQVIDRALLSSVGTGVVTAVSYSVVLYQFVTTLIGAPLTSVLFTELSEAGANNDENGIRNILSSSYKLLMLVCMPIVVILLISSSDIVSIVYGHGNFTDGAVRNCSIGLQMYGLCLLPVCMKKVLSNAYYAVADTKRPMIFGIFEVIVNIFLSIVLVKKFGIYGVVGATAIASIMFIIIMTIDFNLKHFKIISSHEFSSYWKIFVSIFIVLICLNGMDSFHINQSFLSFIINSFVAFLTFFIILLVLKEEMTVTLFNKVFNKYIKK